MPTARWPTVVFDLDGTLVDSIGLIVQSYRHAFRTVLGRVPDEARILHWIGQPLLRCFREASPEHAQQLFDAYTAWNVANTERLLRPYAGVEGLLRDLRCAGVRVGAATSKRRDPAAWALRLCGLDPLVEVLVSLEDTDRHKPDPAPLLLAVDRLGGLPPTSVYVGDAAVDLQAAAAAGMVGIGVTWGAGQRDELRALAPLVVGDVAALGRALMT